MVKCRLALAVSFFVFCVVPNCTATESGSNWFASPSLLKPAELKILWENKLPIKQGESLEKLFVLGNRIYGLSDQNFIVGLNREKGNVILSMPLAKSGFPVMGLGLYGEGLFSVAGNKLVEINSGGGTERSAKRLKFIAACPAARNESHFYIAGTDKRLHVLRSKDKIQVFEVAAESDSAITSVAADENSAVFATTAGDVISIASDESRRLWQFNAAGGIAKPIVRDSESVFVSSGDTNLYRLNAKTGELVWKRQAGAMLDKGPQVTGKMVYQYVRDEGLSAIDKESGKLLWQMKDGVDLLAETDDKTYVITQMGTLTVMDNKRAKPIYTVDLSGVTRYATNVTDSKIYIADKSGRITCLQPIKY
ncbi:MAG: PQQ-binding-like beta-propeller repeat protein [Sedimentisphaerales bacterium]|nr:PQQ-binding-like beta-propeller repeat protein [Sedimentisphaerales bacterium]